MTKPEGFYCTGCDQYHGETGSDAEPCGSCGGKLEYREWKWCAACKDEELTSDPDWSCEPECHLKGHNED